MPIYEYKCRKCSEISEAFQKFSDAPLTRCPQCGGRVDKIMSMNAFHLKGSGWYATDYAGKNSSTHKSGETSADSGCSCGCSSEASAPKDKAEKKPKKKAGAAD